MIHKVFTEWLTLDPPVRIAYLLGVLLVSGLWLFLAGSISFNVWKDKSVLVLLVPLVMLTIVICGICEGIFYGL